LGTAGVLSVSALLTVAAVYLWAHEGPHATLSGKGVAVDARHGTIRLSPEVEKALGLRTEPLTEDVLGERIAAPARVVSAWTGHAFATIPIEGKVLRVDVLPGQEVKAGQVLAEVESLELERLQFDYRSAGEEVRRAEQNVRQLLSTKTGAVAPQQLQDEQALLLQSRRSFALARRKLLSLGLSEEAVDQLSEPSSEPVGTVVIRSPIGGVVLHADIRPGQVVEPTQHLFEVIDPGQVRVEIELLAKDVHRVAIGNRVEVRWPSSAGEGKEALLATVEGKSLALDPEALTGVVWFAPPAGNTPLEPGLRGWADVDLPRSKKVLVAPAAALTREGVEFAVFVRTGPGQFARKSIVTGRQVGNRVEVLGGSVYPGDEVVTTGSHELAASFPATVLRPSPEAARQIDLKVEAAARHPIAETVSLTAAVELPPSRRAVATSRLGGTVRRIVAVPDQAVGAGDLLAEVASLELQDLQLELLSNHFEAERLEQKVQPLRSFAAGNAAFSPRELRDLEASLRSAKLRRDNAHNKLRRVGLTPEQLTALVERQEFVDALPVRAPVGGYVVRFRAALGQVVKADEPLFEIHDPSKAEVRANVPESDRFHVRTGQRARVRLAGQEDRVFEGVVERVEPAVGSADRSLSVWVRVPALPAGLPHGYPAEVCALVAESEPVLAVARDAVLLEGGRSYVFVRGTDGVFERRPVEVGRGDDRFTAVTAGLREGEPVAVRGVAGLRTAHAGLK
jgi:RND family efflux transporter MFP subunit